MIDIISYVPWWAWVALAVAAFGIVRVYTGSWRIAIAVLTFGLALAFQSRSYNKGWQAREAKGRSDAANDIKTAERARASSRRDSAKPGGLRKDDGFKR